jgi:hypothetical protein
MGFIHRRTVELAFKTEAEGLAGAVFAAGVLRGVAAAACVAGRLSATSAAIDRGKENTTISVCQI